MNFSIDKYWKERLGVRTIQLNPPANGWSLCSSGLETFVEPPLSSFSPREFGDSEPNTDRVVLVSAAGAVGKSTLAREIAAATGAVLIDLSETGSVGAHFLVGGLARCGLFDDFRSGRIALIIDGLDEARIKVTSESFGDFFKDVAELSREQSLPIVLMGRTGAIMEAWIHLNDNNVRPAVLKIDFLPRQSAKEFVKRTLFAIRKEKFAKGGVAPERTASADQAAADLLVDKLRDATKGDGGNFVGYAPVLQALARQIASYENPAELVSQLETSAAPITLDTIIETILTREQRKLDQLSIQDASLRERLYTKEEQIARLINRVYEVSIIVDIPPMNPEDKEVYTTALSTWVAEHPFLMDGGTKASSEVFAGYLAWRALAHPVAAEKARKLILRREGKINPFISAFYLPSDWEEGNEGDEVFKALDDIPLVFASHSARVAPPDRVSLGVQSEEDEHEVEVEFVWQSPDWDRSKSLAIRVPKKGILRFGRTVSQVSVVGDDLGIEVGDGDEATFVAPVFFDVNSLLLNCSKLVVESNAPSPLHGTTVHAGDSDGVAIRCHEFEGGVATRPILRGKAGLSVHWPGSEGFPWTEFSTEPPSGLPEGFSEAFQRLRKILLPFKSDKYGALGKYKKFVDGKRRTKGSGKKVRDQLLDEQIMRPDRYVYVLDVERLRERTGLSYQMMRDYEVPDATVEFLRRALSRPE